MIYISTYPGKFLGTHFSKKKKIQYKNGVAEIKRRKSDVKNEHYHPKNTIFWDQSRKLGFCLPLLSTMRVNKIDVLD